MSRFVVSNTSEVVRIDDAKPGGAFWSQHPRLGALAERLALPLIDRYYRRSKLYRSSSRLAAMKRDALRTRLARGERAWLADIGIGGHHNTGVALVEIDPESGPRIIRNNEEERFSGRKRTNQYPHASLEALLGMIQRLGIAPEQITAWLATWDYPLLAATGIRALLEEFPGSASTRRPPPNWSSRTACSMSSIPSSAPPDQTGWC